MKQQATDLKKQISLQQAEDVEHRSITTGHQDPLFLLNQHPCTDEGNPNAGTVEGGEVD